MTQDRWDRLMAFSERVGLPGVILLGALLLGGFLIDKYLDRAMVAQERLMDVLESVRDQGVSNDTRRDEILIRIANALERERK